MNETKLLAGLEVVVIDDNRAMLDLMRTILDSIGVGRVRTFSEAMEGLKAIRSAPPDFVMTDQEMTPITGLDFVRLLRSDRTSKLAELPVLMITGRASRSMVVAARDAGVDDFVIKPVSPQRVANGLKSLLQRPRRILRAPEYIGPDRRRRQVRFDGFDRRDALVEPQTLHDAELAVQALREQYEEDLVPVTTRMVRLLSEAATEKDTASALRQLFRIAHDFKGQGSSFGYPLLSEFGESLAQLLRGRKELGTLEHRLAKAHVEAMATVARNRIRGDGGDVGRALRRSFNRLVEALEAES